MTMRDSARLAIKNHFFRVYSFPVPSDLYLGMPGEGKQDMQTGRRGAFLPLLELFGPIFGMTCRTTCKTTCKLTCKPT